MSASQSLYHVEMGTWWKAFGEAFQVMFGAKIALTVGVIVLVVVVALVAGALSVARDSYTAAPIWLALAVTTVATVVVASRCMNYAVGEAVPISAWFFRRSLASVYAEAAALVFYPVCIAGILVGLFPGAWISNRRRHKHH